MITKVLASEWIPAKKDSRKLMIVLHGRGDSPAGFRWMPSALAVSELNYLLVQAPAVYFTGYSWYDLPPNQGPGITRSRGILDQLMIEILQEGYRTEDCLLFGFSQGCLMTLEWAGRSHYAFAGLIGISGYCYDPVALAQELSNTAKASQWLITHGTLDDVLSYEVTQQQMEYLLEAGLPINFKSYQKAHTIDEQYELPMLRQWVRSALGLEPAAWP